MLPNRESALNDFQTRFVLPFGVFAASTILLFGVFMIMKAHGVLLDGTQREQTTSARIAAMGIEQALAGVSDTLGSIARTPAARGADAAAAKLYLNNYTAHDNMLAAVYVLNANGEVLVSAGKSPDGGSAALQDECFSKVIKGANTCYSDVELDQSGAYRTYVFVPVENENGSVSRVVVGAVPINTAQIKTAVLGASPGIHGFAMLVDRGGNVVLNGDSSRNAPISLKNEDIVKQGLAGNRGSMGYKYGPVYMLASFCPVEGPGWTVIMQRPASEVGGYAEFIGLALIFLVLGTLGAVALAVVQSQGVTRFLFQLTGRIDNLTRGRLDLDMSGEPERRETRSEEREGAEEMATISTSFNKLLKNMREDRKRTEASFKDALDTAKFNQSVVESFSDALVVVGANMQALMAGGGMTKYSDVDAGSIPGKMLASLGRNWTQGAITEAAKLSIRDGVTQTISDIRMKRRDGVECAMELRVYPLQGKTPDRNGGAVIYGMEVGDIISRQDSLRKAEKSFRDIISAAGDPLIIMDSDFRVEWMNGSAEKITGAAGVGADFRELTPTAHRARFEQFSVRVLNTGEAPPPFEMEIEAGGAKSHVEASLCQALGEGRSQKLVLTLRKVPPTRKVERVALRDRDAMEKKIRFLTCALDATPVAVALVDASGRVIQVNRMFEKLFKERREVFIGKQISVFHGGDSKYFDLAAVAKTGSQRLETFVNAVGGARMLVEAWAHALAETPAGQGTAFLCAFREIGAERSSNDRAKRDAWDGASLATSREIANKLMPPLTGLVQSLHSLGGNIFSDKNRGMWSAAMRGSKCLNQSVNMLMMFSAEQPLEAGPCRIEGIIDETIDVLERHGMIPPGVYIDRDYAEDLPACEADADQMKMVIWNLLLNSMQAVEAQGPDAQVKVNAYSRMHKGKQVLMVDVLDSGPEFNEADAAKFFEPFNGTREGGIGLGLTLSRRALERHGGRIGMERKDGYTRVSFVLPVRIEAETAKRNKALGATKSGVFN